GDANAPRHSDRLMAANSQTGALLFRKLRLLNDPDTLFRPLDFRSDKQVYEEAIVVVEVDAVGQLGKRFHARSGAAPEGIERQTEQFPVAGGERHVVERHTVVGGLGAEDAVDTGASR